MPRSILALGRSIWIKLMGEPNKGHLLRDKEEQCQEKKKQSWN